ncbi:C39 family peptidase [Clostridium hydrogenum]|uniref:C39 family peptidase n=1 Tax=Clostridium hydrogenum TaxID=2855764 RepID=UPI001F1B0ABC|nr:C39 family peptidase [Clostridium hydrogenum]
MFNEESGEENKNSSVKSFIGGIAKKKGKQVLKKVLIKIMIPWGFLICFALFIIIFCIGAAKVGSTGEHTFSDTMNKYDNKTLAGYLKVKVKNANGATDDYYGMAKRVGLTEGNVEGFISLAELETGKDMNKMLNDKKLTDLLVGEFIITKYTELLKPNFTYKDDYIVTTTTTNVKDSTGKNLTSTKTDKKKIKLLTEADTIKGKVDITYKVDSTSSSQTSTRTYDAPGSQTVLAAQNSSQPAPTLGTQNVAETTTVTTKVDTPIIDKVTESEKHFERLKGIIKSTFPNEKSDDNLDMAVHYVINGTGSDYDTSEQNGDWMNLEVEEDIVDDIMGEDGGGFSGTIPLFRQTDPRWCNIPFGDKDIYTSGCGPTSFAMVVSGLEGKLGSWDLNGDGILDPGEAAKYAQKSGYDTKPCSWDLFGQTSAGRFGLTSTQTKDSNIVYSALKEGYPVIASMHAGHFTKGGHFIVLTGVDSDGQVLINDPNPANGITKFSMDGIAAEANVFWIFKNPNMKLEQYELTVYGGHKDAMEGLSGITADGTNVNGYLDFSPRIIATDTSVIPLGSKVYIKFPESIRHEKTADGKDFDMNGIYTARDTGGAFHGGVKHVDLFMGYGSYAEQMIKKIGKCEVAIMKK